MQKIRIAVLGTGGTIAAEASSLAEVLRYQDSQLSAADTLTPLAQHLPENVELLPMQLSRLGSENFSTDTWFSLAHALLRLEASEQVDGFVLTQGTDTLEETPYFLQLALRLPKPVVLVGAMRPATALSADGPLNLLRAIQIAASQSTRGFGAMVVANDCAGWERLSIFAAPVTVPQRNTALMASYLWNRMVTKLEVSAFANAAEDFSAVLLY